MEGFFQQASIMPIYAYRCGSCGFQKDVLQKLSDAPLTDCPSCGAAAFSKQLSAPAFQLKGSGWYVTDFRDNGKKPGEAGATGDKAAGSAEGGGDKVTGAPAAGAPAAAPAGGAAAPAPASPAPAPAPAPAAGGSASSGS
jgi:putative FmdB family regulatory protein